MRVPFIKICGIRKPETAFYAAHVGADFIGIMFYKKSKRYVDRDTARGIALSAKAGGAEVVGVFVEDTAYDISSICEEVSINIVQLHGDIARREAKKLPKVLRQIYVIDVNDDGSIREQEKENIVHLDRERDFLLFDCVKHGSGRSFKLDLFRPRRDFKFFLAGGLNVDNVKQAISIVNPYGVDVSSGVEDESGYKHIHLIQQFIQQVK